MSFVQPVQGRLLATPVVLVDRYSDPGGVLTISGKGQAKAACGMLTYRPLRHFTAPTVSPFTSIRCNQANTTATGKVATNVAAITWFHATE